MDKKILYIDMDGVVADFNKKLGELAPHIALGDGDDYEERSKMVDEVAKQNITLFEDLEPIKGAIEAIDQLKDKYEIYFLSTPMSAVPESYTGKKRWINQHFGEWATKRLILTHRKDLCIGDYLIDDRLKNGAMAFKGRFLLFGSSMYPDWDYIIQYLNSNH